MRKEEVEDAPNMVTGNFTITHHVEVLFDSGVVHSFISARLVRKMQGTLMSRHSMLSIALPDGKMMNVQELFIDCPILIHSHDFLADLYRFELTEFDIILGMDCLSKHQAQIDCLKQKITLRGPKDEKIVHRGKSRGSGVRLITTIRAQKLLKRSCEGYSCNVVETETPKTSLKSIPIV